MLHSFAGSSDGKFPNAGLIFDASGNLYGDTYSGGDEGSGTVLKLPPNSHGGWAEEVLYSFTGELDGGAPVGNLLISNGTLYGAANVGGNAYQGVVHGVLQ